MVQAVVHQRQEDRQVPPVDREDQEAREEERKQTCQVELEVREEGQAEDRLGQVEDHLGHEEDQEEGHQDQEADHPFEEGQEDQAEQEQQGRTVTSPLVLVQPEDPEDQEA